MIAVFSGTGNSMMVARLLSRALGDRIVSYPSVPHPAEGERMVWVFPVYAWNIPPNVRHVMERCLVTRTGAVHWAVMTCGDDTGLTARSWRRLVTRYGETAAQAFSVQMPNTYVTLPGFDTDPIEVEQRKLDAAPARVADIARHIAAGLPAGADDVVRGSFPALKSGPVNVFFRRFLMSPKPFGPTDACVGCGICASMCPEHNIILDENRRPRWSANCDFCLRCYHACPHHAVAYGRATRHKSRYTALLRLVAPEKRNGRH